ncbi:MAG: PstS family phosphate ABC transporter substrate-binding protein [Ardenticatenales bacterium]|nr:PstS family phosphate ABC transporter substrate-binding protein [Ardenticatenales bacterium]
MSTPTRSSFMRFGFIAVAALTMAACGPEDAPPAAEPTAATVAEMPTTAPAEMPTDAPAPSADAGAVQLAPVDPSAVTGDIVTAGSSTVFPLSERIAARFKDEGYAGNVTIDSVGTGAGFERFCTAGETDIANASRAIKDEEKANCAKINREVVEFRVGTDALAIVVNPENTWAEDITVEELKTMFSGAKTWQDVRADWPAEPVKLFSPGTDSGTFDYFVEAVFEKDEAPLLAANPQMSEDDNILAQGVEGDKGAIGYFGYAYYAESGGKLKILKVDGVEAGGTTVEDGTYPLSRPLFIYSSKDVLTAKPQVASFVSYYLSTVNEEIVEAGYFPASAEALDEAETAWTTAAGQ